MRSDPLRPLSPTLEVFCVNHGAHNIVNQWRRDHAKYTPSFRSQPPRARNTFIDDAAIESDGEGGGIASRATTLPSSIPSSPARLPTPTIDLSIEVLIVKTKRKVRKPNEHCKTCNRFVNGIKQLEFHLKFKKHLKQVRNSVSTNCKTCNSFFTSKHNFANHKCKTS